MGSGAKNGRRAFLLVDSEVFRLLVTPVLLLRRARNQEVLPIYTTTISPQEIEGKIEGELVLLTLQELQESWREA
jgi:hypothetical protein